MNDSERRYWYRAALKGLAPGPKAIHTHFLTDLEIEDFNSLMTEALRYNKSADYKRDYRFLGLISAYKFFKTASQPGAHLRVSVEGEDADRYQFAWDKLIGALEGFMTDLESRVK